ncbi:helix-turn-helix DNA binding domain [Arthrobacter phage Racecar]|nr:helix-turn-helix DNA binding domain protein [Arthrobacter phage Racecar]
MAPRVTFNPEAGEVFGELTVVHEEYLPNTPGREKHGFTKGLRGYRCKCSCGNEIVVGSGSLNKGLTISCGHVKIEKATARTKSMSENNVTHGMHHHPLYDTWSGMMTRCFNDSHVYYHRYGGRGISVCEEWTDVVKFISDIEATLGERPEGMTLDRIDNDGNYELSNVRWATHSEQMRNRSK